MRNCLMSGLFALLTGLVPLTGAHAAGEQDALPAAKSAAASATVVSDKDASAKVHSAQSQRDAVKSRRDHRRTVNHRLRRRV